MKNKKTEIQKLLEKLRNLQDQFYETADEIRLRLEEKGKARDGE